MSDSHQSPVIGITVKHGNSTWLERNTKNYLQTLANFAVEVVVLSPDQPARLPSGDTCQPDEMGRIDPAILDSLDGLILSGGGDVDPSYFNAPLDGAEVDRIDRKRDELELTLSSAAMQRNLPLFGICRGCQVLNVAAGGGMRQHLDGHRSSKDQTSFHPIHLEPSTKLFEVVRQPCLSVNTFHHQGLDEATLAPGFIASAVAEPDDWLIEAIESSSHTWTVGVQWHPERVFELPKANLRLWHSFIAACQATASSTHS